MTVAQIDARSSARQAVGFVFSGSVRRRIRSASRILAERFADQISDSDYEVKVAGLLRRSLTDEIGRDPQAKDLWQQAWSVLKEGDHYILIMIDAAVGQQRTPWWRFCDHLRRRWHRNAASRFQLAIFWSIYPRRTSSCLGRARSLRQWRG
jgi:hypothetical protein